MIEPSVVGLTWRQFHRIRGRIGGGEGDKQGGNFVQYCKNLNNLLTFDYIKTFNTKFA